MSKIELDSFTSAYVECALYSSCDDDDMPLDKSFDVSNISPETLDKMIEDCKNFQESNQSDLAIYLEEFPIENAGHDFWLNRNGHGAGFWDRTSKSSPLRDACMRLSEASKVWGSFDLHVADEIIYSF